MDRLAQTIGRLQEPAFQEQMREAKALQRARWRANTQRYQERHGRPPTPKTHRSYVHRWKEIQVRRHFLRLGLPCRCGATERLEVSHKVALKDGGGFDLDNLQWLCHDCHVDYDAKEQE